MCLEVRHVVWSGQVPCFAVFDEGVATRRVRADRRYPGGHCLECHVAKCFGLAWKEKDIRRSVRGSQFAATEVSGKNGFWKLLFEFRARRALADNQNPVPTRTGPQAPTDFLYDIQTLLGHEAGHKSHDDVIVADAELLTPLQRASARMKPFGINTSRPIQQSVVDPVR